ncbi:YfaZ family outer membrane protein [Nissabacter sp. SGAir0207]|uniref:YfaZ family outer membrane protein n=1 Tax=Nissabacter sp. SGAir0207 TaxID=2126321 RepID=UPI0010CCCF94|nr:YfaZ family outer membrane protein [Nissabacter sp. SGAir0207]QCR35515.1 porin [Nissabacter sp. SGAir0207]
MKTTSLVLAATLLCSAATAQAISISGQAGQHYTSLGADFGADTAGLTTNLNWAHSDNDGDIAGIGLGLNVPLGPVMATVGGKALYLGPQDGDEGYALAVGGGLSLPMGRYFALYGEGYYAPDSLSSGVNDYAEANGGLRLNVIPLLSVDIGYRYMAMAGKDGHRDNVLADGPYLGAALHF